jgi:phosphoribosylformylglycinamidine synthase
MQEIEDAVRGLCDAARSLGVRGLPGTPLPYVSGNVSLYNESRSGKSIPPTPIVACLGVLLDFAAARGQGLQRPGDLLFHVGAASEALGASLYAEATEQLRIRETDVLPELDLEREREQDFAVLDAYDARIVQACRAIGKGGILLALLRMACTRSGTLERGARCILPPSTQQPIAALFAEAPGFVCEIRPEDAAHFEAVCAARQVHVRRLGEVIPAAELQIHAHERSWDLPLAELAAIWMHALDRVLSEEETA